MTNLWRRVAIVACCVALALTGLSPAARPAAAATCEPRDFGDDASASELLAAERPFAPTNRDMFISYQSPDWEDAAPPVYPKGPAPTEQETKEALRHILELRFPCEPERVTAGLAVFTNPLAVQKIADPTLRAALAALTGTLGEPAIDFLLYQAPVSAVFFGVVLHYGDGIPTGTTATAYPMPDGTWVVVFDSLYRYIRFDALSALLFHELLHVEAPAAGPDSGSKPDGVGQTEETTAVALESIIYMQMLLADPSLASAPDILTRGANNHMTLARLNSGQAGTDRLNLFMPDNTVSITPLTTEPITEFAAYYDVASYDGSDVETWQALETHGNALLATVLPALAEPGQSAPELPDYDRETLEFLDQNLAVLTPAELITVACILGLDLPCDEQSLVDGETR